MADYTLNAAVRHEFGKGAARRLRRDGKIPAVIYGHGQEPEHLALPAHASELALRNPNALLELAFEGLDSKMALPKQIQRHPVTGRIEHVDLIIVRRGEKVVVEVPIVIEGEAGPDTVVLSELTTLEVQAEATSIPTEIIVSVEGLEAGAQITAGDVKLPEGTEITGDPEQLVINITAQISAEELEAELEVSDDATGEVATVSETEAAADEEAEA